MLALFLFVLQAFAACPGGAGACVTSWGSTHENYCLYGPGGLDLVGCYLEADGHQEVHVTGTSSDYAISVAGPDGTFCCDSGDYAADAATISQGVFATCDLGDADSCKFDFAAMSFRSWAIGSYGDDEFLGGSDVDTFEGGDGDDEMYGNSGADHLGGDGDSDYIDGGLGDDDVCADDLLGSGACSTNATGGGCNNILIGGAGQDIIFGADVATTGGCAGDYIDSGPQDDELTAFAGTDTLCGGADVDDLDGGAGDDYLYGGTGGDVQNGGLHQDRCENDGAPSNCESNGTTIAYTTSCPAEPTWP